MDKQTNGTISDTHTHTHTHTCTNITVLTTQDVLTCVGINVKPVTLSKCLLVKYPSYPSTTPVVTIVTCMKVPGFAL